MFTINTYIKDIDTSEGLPFASAVLTDSKGKFLPINGVTVGRKADEDGKLIIPVANEAAYITVSYVGYETITHPADDYQNDTIYLKAKSGNVFSSGSDFEVKAKRIYPKSKPVVTKKKMPTWIIYAAVAAGVLVVGSIIYLIAKKK